MRSLLHEAAEKGDVQEVKRLLERGEDVDVRTTRERTPPDETKPAFLSALESTLDSSGSTPLHVAASNGHAEVVALLLENGADPNAKNRIDVTPLHMAAMDGHLPVVELLVAHGADVNARQCANQTALHLANWKGRRKVVKFLKRHGGVK